MSSRKSCGDLACEPQTYFRSSLLSLRKYVVVQFYPWFKFSFLLFLGMVMYDNNMIMSLKQKKRKFEPQHIYRKVTYS